MNFKYQAETGCGLNSVVFLRESDSAADTSAAAYVEDAKVLYDKLFNGFQRYGAIKIPIAGDPTRLQFAEGLPSRQRRMAKTQRSE